MCVCVCVCACVCVCGVRVCVHVCVRVGGLNNSLVIPLPGLVNGIMAGSCPEVVSRGPGPQTRRGLDAPGAEREKATTDEGHDPIPGVESSRAGGTGDQQAGKKRREMNDSVLDHAAGKEGKKSRCLSGYGVRYCGVYAMGLGIVCTGGRWVCVCQAGVRHF